MIANFLSKTMENFKRNIRQGTSKWGVGSPAGGVIPEMPATLAFKNRGKLNF